MLTSNLDISSALYLYLRPGLCTDLNYIFHLSLDCCRFLSWKNGSGAATITSNKIRFSAVCLSDPIILTVKFALSLFPFPPNQCRLLGGPP